MISNFSEKEDKEQCIEIIKIYKQFGCLNTPFYSKELKIETLVDKEKRVVKGFISTIENSIEALFVHPDFVRQGIGTIKNDFPRVRQSQY